MTNKTPFAQTLRKLRENKKISQKTVSQELGISQALLSHYEKGVRECGLNFLIKAAKYYNVSADFLLGLELKPDTLGDTENINITESENNKNNENNINNISEDKYNNYPVLCKNLLSNVINYIFSGMKNAEYRQTAKISGEYMLVSTYLLYKYLVPSDVGAGLASLEEISAAESKLIVELKKNNKCPESSEFLQNDYISSMIKNSENIISRLNLS